MHQRHSTSTLFERPFPHIRSRQDNSNCHDANPTDGLTDRLNTLLNSSGPGYVLSLCPNQQYPIEAPLLFTAPSQEISTQGYPSGDDRAMLIVNGPSTDDGNGHTTAVDGTCADCGGVKLRHVQINGTRAGAGPIGGGANIEFGGANSGQLIEYVRSFDPRSWSCMHIQEGGLKCDNATVQNNDIGPCGSDAFQQWADGISVACNNSLIRNNLINNPTDGGIVLFGAPGTRVENNTIWVETQTLLGGINMVDYDPYFGDYTGTIVTNNTIAGGFSSEKAEAGETKGADSQNAVIKIGIAIGPRTWFGERYGDNVSTSGTVINNQLTGAFSYAIAISSASNFTVENNVLFGNTSFLGAVGPNCTSGDEVATVPNPAAFVLDQNNTRSLTTQSDFQVIPDGDGLTCVMPPDGGDYWPFGGNPGGDSRTPPVSPPESNTTQGGGDDGSRGGSDSGSGSGSHSTAGQKAGIAIGVILGVLAIAVATWSIRKWALQKQRAQSQAPLNASRGSTSYRKSEDN